MDSFRTTVPPNRPQTEIAVPLPQTSLGENFFENQNYQLLFQCLNGGTCQFLNFLIIDDNENI